MLSERNPSPCALTATDQRPAGPSADKVSPATLGRFVEGQIKVLEDHLLVGGAILHFEAAMGDAEPVEGLILPGHGLDQVPDQRSQLGGESRRHALPEADGGGAFHRLGGGQINGDRVGLLGALDGYGAVRLHGQAQIQPDELQSFGFDVERRQRRQIE